MGFEPRPIAPGTKACKIPGWNRPNDVIGSDELARWEEKYATHGIGLLCGTVLSDGTRFGAIDVDDNRRTNLLSALLQNAPRRVGAKGQVTFVRYVGNLASGKIGVKSPARSGEISVGDLLFAGRLVVLPPTIHPDTGNPYVWLSKPLLDWDLKDIPLIGMSRDLGAA
jgi:hypothetical protein